MTDFTRRQALTFGAAAATVLAQSGPAFALSESDAKAHVGRTLDDLLALLKTPGSSSSRAPRLRQIMETRSNLPLVAKFSAGRVWREMSSDQQNRFVDAFSHYIAVTYARRFDEYSGNPDIALGRARDAGRKGWLVETPIKLPSGDKAVVEWLVSDRAGAIQVVDMIIEGISMAATQREEIAAKFKKRGNDVEALITDLKSAI